MENLVVGGGKILSRKVDEKMLNLCVQERGEGQPKNLPLGKGGV